MEMSLLLQARERESNEISGFSSFFLSCFSYFVLYEKILRWTQPIRQINKVELGKDELDEAKWGQMKEGKSFLLDERACIFFKAYPPCSYPTTHPSGK